MGHSDAERPHGLAPPMCVTVISRLRMAVKMHMPRTVMVVLMQVPALSQQLHAEQTAKRDEHESNHTFRHLCDRLGNRKNRTMAPISSNIAV
jgi:hypothetical protein